MENKNVKYVQGPKFPTPQEMSFSDLIREYVVGLMDSVPGSTNKKLDLIAVELNKRAEEFMSKKKSKGTSTPLPTPEE